MRLRTRVKYRYSSAQYFGEAFFYFPPLIKNAKSRYRYYVSLILFYFFFVLPISADPPQVPCCDCLANLVMASVYSLDAEAAPENYKKKSNK